MNRSRLVAVRTSVKRKRVRVSSGCVIAPRLVLTAGHALQPQGAAMSAAGVHVEVQLLTEGRPVPAEIVWDGRSADLDAAVLQVAPEHWPREGIADSPVRWGQFVTLRAGQPADALGFAHVQSAPRADGLETAQVSGAVSPGDRMIAGRWELSVDRAPADLDESQWSGLSGAALWSGPLLCGVVVVESAHWKHGKLQAEPAHRLLREESLRELLRSRIGYVPVAEAVELEALCEPAVPSRTPRLPSELLRPQAEAVPFAGRAVELRDFEAWCTEGGGLATRLITGLGGQGKTRFARELTVRMAVRGWVTAQLREADAERRVLVSGLEALTAVDRRVLLVMDYAETSPELVGTILELLEARGGHHPVRLVLIARSTGEWWEHLSGRSAHSAGVLSGAHTVELHDVATTSAQRARMYRDAVEALARRLPGLRELRALPEYDGVDWPAVTRAVLAVPYRDSADGSALHLHMRALLELLRAADGQARAGASRDRHGPEPDVQAELLHHEQRYWKRTAGLWGTLGDVRREVLADAVAVATLTRAAVPARAEELLALIPALPEDRAAAASGWLHELYPPAEGSYWGALEPDLLGEYHVALRARENPRLLTALLPKLRGREAERALTVLARAAAQPTCPFPELARRVAELIVAHPETLAVPAAVVAGRSENPGFLLDALRRLAARRDLPLDLLETLHAAVPDRSRLLGEQALDIAERIARAHRRRARLVGGDLALAPARVRAELARAEHNLAVRLSSVRRWAEAVERSGRAVRLYRGLATGDAAAAHLPLLADSLGVRWGALFELGRYREALADCAEAVRVNRRLVQGESGGERTPTAEMRYRAGLGQALSNLSVVLGARYLQTEALAAAEEAVEILERLVRERPTRQHLALFAGALHTLANRQNFGEEALRTVTHSVLIRRRLAQVHPDAYLPSLVESLHNQALELATLGRHQIALGVIDECLRVTLQLAEDQPTMHHPMLARILCARAAALNEVGKRDEAARTVFRALLVSRQLAMTEPATYEPVVEYLLRRAADTVWDAFANTDMFTGLRRWKELFQEAEALGAARRHRAYEEEQRATRWPRFRRRLARRAGTRVSVRRVPTGTGPWWKRLPRFTARVTVPLLRPVFQEDERTRDQREFKELLSLGDLIRTTSDNATWLAENFDYPETVEYSAKLARILAEQA